ncbi:MAG: hypothetical protein H6659_18655 [Ardenticatenaceae bacterium]|nr:hypothetical protein [Ardenticatenaceae bacterium]
MWRDQLTPEELAEVRDAMPGSLIHKLAMLLDKKEFTVADGRIPQRGMLNQFDNPNRYIPPNIVRLDE